jgi:hypothetical protein
VTASYTEGAVTKTATISGIVVNNVQLVSISVSGTPNKTSYFAGENFVPTGVTITAHYDDSSSRTLGFEEVTFAPTPLTAGTTSVTVTFDNGVTQKSTSISGLTVTAVVLNDISIKTPATKVNFKLGETFSSSGLVINANYNNGTVEKTSGFSVTGVNTMVLGAQTATVTFESKTVTYAVDVTNQGVAVSSPSGGVASDLFISEYIEGSSYNKAIEIYNGTGASVNLADYSLKLYSNGSASVGNTLALSGTLANDDVYVLAYTSGTNAAAAEILAVADITNGTVINFNGDDSVALFKGDTLIDLFGDITTGTDPGTSWSVPYYGSGETTATTINSTWVRHSSVTGPNSISPFASTEWEVYAEDTFSYLGSHDFDDIPIQGDVTSLEQATSFANYVMTGIGNLAEGNCVAALAELNAEYAFMSDLAKAEFTSNSGTVFVNARARMAYLTSWVAAQSPSGIQSNPEETSKSALIASAIIGIVGLSTIAGFYFLRKKKETF